MTPRRSSDDGPIDRLVDALVRPARRVNVLVAVAYLAALAGLGVVLTAGLHPRSDLFTAGLLLLVLAFLTLFYASVTVLETAGDG